MLHFFVLLSVVISCGGCCPCEHDLVTGPYGVSDNAFSASSTHAQCFIANVRFDSSIGWCPTNTASGNYIQVEFQSISLLTAIQTKGRGNADQRVTSYSVDISMDGLSWTSLLNATGDVQVFPGNTDRNTVVTNFLEGLVIAKYIRVIAVSTYSYGSMRLEVKGCPYSESTCNRWKAKLGSSGDTLTVLLDEDASNQGQCGMKCIRQPQCDSFLFDVTSAGCKLLNGTVDGSFNTVNLHRVWYFVRI